MSKDLKSIRNISGPLDKVFVDRYSPRAYSGAPIPEEVFREIVEAGRVAPSSFNLQPWRLIYGHRDTPDWQPLFDLLVEPNQIWVKNAAILMMFISNNRDSKGRPARTASFDCGSFWMSMALEGFRRGYPLHAMSGFSYEKARTTFKISDQYTVEAMACIGVPGSIESLPESYQEKEKNPSGRKSLDEILIKTNRASVTLALPNF